MAGPGVQMPTAHQNDALKTAIRDRLTATRNTTLDLLTSLTDHHLYDQPEPVMGVLAWDLGHVGFFEHLWLVENLDGDPIQHEDATLYDPFEHPRSERGSLDLPGRKRLREYLDTVRQRALTVLEETNLAAEDPLTNDGFVHDLIIRHEDQHRETMLITLTLFGDTPETTQPGEPIPHAYTPSNPTPTPDPKTDTDGTVRIPGGQIPIGTPRTVGTYDNEWPQHTVELEPFEIDKAPVTNEEFLAFLQDDGYHTQEHWSTDGWMIRQALDRTHPKHWTQTDQGSWLIRRNGQHHPLPLEEPVSHVSYYEAQAYAAWANKRLPTETEWEAAASYNFETQTKHRFPWGDAAWTPNHANLGQRTHQPAPVGAYPQGVSPNGAHQMIGDVWEWTRSTFTGYPGFEPFPYPEYSKAHFDQGYQVLRGGSWATMPSCAHATFRNWHQPDHQHLFAGFRCARSIPP